MKKLFSLVLTLVLLCAALPQSAGAWYSLSYTEARISSSPAVYSGPGTNYYRAAGGKAQYGKGGVARIYGKTGTGWLMIGYQTGKGIYRIGYVKAGESDLYNWSGSYMPTLSFDFYDAYINTACLITMDPVCDYTQEAWLPQGTWVKYLANLDGTWDYVEAETSLGTMRGFVRTENVTIYTKPTATPQPTRTWKMGILSYVTGRFTANYDVYMGPGYEYPRSGNGKATLGANGVCRIFGRDGNWLMVGYEASSGDYRIGYICNYTLPDGISYDYAGDISSIYLWESKYITARTKVTDDPVINMKAVEYLQEGANVTLLAWTGEKHKYAFVEYYSPTYQCYARGFVLGQYLADY